ncbi:hypothetical protein D3C76_1440990 [compost metagenome]
MATAAPSVEPRIKHNAFSITRPVSGRACSIIEATIAQNGLSRSRPMETASANATADTPFSAKRTLRKFGCR